MLNSDKKHFNYPLENRINEIIFHCQKCKSAHVLPCSLAHVSMLESIECPFCHTVHLINPNIDKPFFIKSTCNS